MDDATLSSDLRALTIGILCGLITIYLHKAISWYVTRRTVRGRKRKLAQAQAELKLLEKLGSTDRAVLLFGFQVLFGILMLISISMVGALLLALVHEPVDDKTFIDIMAWSIVGIISFWVSTVFKKLEDPQPIDDLRQKIAEMQDENKGQS